MVWTIFGGIYPILFIIIAHWLSTKFYPVVNMYDYHPVNENQGDIGWWQEQIYQLSLRPNGLKLLPDYLIT